MPTDILRVEAQERVDLADFQYAIDEQQNKAQEQVFGEFMTDNTAVRAWILDGFTQGFAGAQITVTKGRAILSRREQGTVLYGALTTEGEPTRILDLSTFADGTYGVYIRFEYVDGASQSRTFWNAAGNGNEFSKTVPTRRQANWSLRVETGLPGAEWLQIGDVTVATAVITGVTDKRPMYFEGAVDASYASGWSTDGGGDALDRDADRQANGVKDMQTFTQAMRQCLKDIKGRGLREWYSRDIGGMNIGFDGDPSEDQLKVGDVNFKMSAEFASSPRIQFDNADLLAYGRASGFGGIGEFQFFIQNQVRCFIDSDSVYTPVGLPNDLGRTTDPWPTVYATNVGVGLTAAPLTPLHVRKSLTSYASAFADTVAVFERNLDSFIDIVTGTSNISGIRFSDTGSTTSGRFEYSHGFDRFQWWVQGAPRMKMLLGELSPWSAGFDLGSTTVPWGNVYADNVGIGITAAPLARLHVSPGNSSITLFAGRSIALGAHLVSSSGRTGFSVTGSNSFLGVSDDAAFNYFHPFDAANALATYKVFRIATGTEVGADDNPAATMTDRFWVQKNGGAYFGSDVGIGKPTPAVSLDIAGGVRARSGAPGANGVNNNGYAFDADSDSGMFSLVDGVLSFFINSLERIQVSSAGLSVLSGTTGAQFNFNPGLATSTYTHVTSLDDTGVHHAVSVSNRTHRWSIGGAVKLTLDESGHLLPTVQNSQNIGSNTLLWGRIYSQFFVGGDGVLASESVFDTNDNGGYAALFRNFGNTNASHGIRIWAGDSVQSFSNERYVDCYTFGGSPMGFLGAGGGAGASIAIFNTSDPTAKTTSSGADGAEGLNLSKVDALGIVNAIRVVEFKFKQRRSFRKPGESLFVPKGTGPLVRAGFSADNLLSVYPEMVTEAEQIAYKNGDPKIPVNDGTTLLHENRVELIPILAKAIQEQQASITKLQLQISKLLN